MTVEDYFNKYKIIPLHYFERESDESLLLEKASIKTIRDITLNHTITNYTLPKFLLEIDKDITEISQELLEKALIIFKLFDENSFGVYFDLVMSNEDIKSSKSWQFFQNYRPWVDFTLPIPIFSLKKIEEPNFVQHWNDYLNINIKNFAVSRFLSANSKINQFDQFVDYILALEYLFAPDSGQGEISYKFRTRGSQILGGNDRKKREEVYKNLNRFYKIRSAVVHGKDKELAKINWLEELNIARNYTRQAIIFFYEKNLLDNGDNRGNYLKNKLVFEPRIDF